MSTSTAIRRTALAAASTAALAAVLTQTLAGPVASTGAMPRARIVAPVDSPVSSGPRVVTLAGHADLASATAGRPGSSSENHIQLAPYQTPIGAVVTARSSMEAYLTASLYDVHNTWSRLFKGWNFKQPTVTYVFPGKGEVRSSCGGNSNDQSFFYCPREDTIVISQEGARKLWLGERGRYTIQGTGDMSVALLVAHEYGHNIAAELGWGARASAAAGERVADCFGGVWSRDAARRGLLESGDVNEALQALDLFAEHPGQSDNGVHGTPAQRQHAFKIGYNQDAAACVNTFLR